MFMDVCAEDIEGRCRANDSHIDVNKAVKEANNSTFYLTTNQLNFWTRNYLKSDNYFST
jgi:hypothetical protein